MTSEKIGERIGFVFMMIVSSIILFFVLKILGKLPDSWNYFYVLILIIIITSIGVFIKRLLK